MDTQNTHDLGWSVRQERFQIRSALFAGPGEPVQKIS